MKKSIKILALVLTLVLLCGVFAVVALATGEEATNTGVRELVNEDFEAAEEVEYPDGSQLGNSDSNQGFITTGSYPTTSLIYAARNGSAKITHSEYDATNKYFNWSSNSEKQGANDGSPYLVFQFGDVVTKDNYETRDTYYGTDITALVMDFDVRFPTGTCPQYVGLSPIEYYLNGEGTRCFKGGTKPQVIFRQSGDQVICYTKVLAGGWSENIYVFDNSAWNHFTMVILPVVKTDANDVEYLELYNYFYVNGELVLSQLYYTNESEAASGYYNGDKTKILVSDMRLEIPKIYDTTGNTQMSVDNVSLRATTPEYTGNLMTVLDTEADIVDADVNVYDPDNMPFGTIVCTNTTTSVNYDSLQKAINNASTEETETIVLKANVTTDVTVDKLVRIECGDYTVGNVAGVGEIIVKQEEGTNNYYSEYAQEGLSVQWNACTCGLDVCDETHPGDLFTTVYESQTIASSYTEDLDWSCTTDVPAKKYVLLGWQDVTTGEVFDVNTVVTSELITSTDGYVELNPIIGTYDPVLTYTNGAGEVVEAFTDTSLGDVFVDMKAGTAIELLADVKVTGTVGVSKAATLVLGGYTIDAVNTAATSGSKFHLFNVGNVEFTVDGTEEGSKIICSFYNGSKFQGDSLFTTGASTVLTVEGEGLTTYSSNLVYLGGGDITINGGAHYNTNSSDHWGYFQVERCNTVNVNNALLYTENQGSILAARGNSMSYVAATITPTINFNNCVLIPSKGTGNVMNWGCDRVHVNFNACYIAGSVNPSPYGSNTGFGTVTLGAGCYLASGASVKEGVNFAEGCEAMSITKNVSYALKLNTFAADATGILASTYETTDSTFNVTYGSVVADPTKTVPVTWYDTDGVTVLGTTEAIAGLEASAPQFAVEGTEGWVNALYSDWTNESGEATTVVPADAESASFTLVEGSGVEYVAGNIPLYMNYELILHFQLNVYAPVEAPAGITDYKVNGSTISGNWEIGGVKYGYQNAWPNAHGLDDDKSYVVTFTYDGISLSKSYVANVGNYAEYILGSDEFDAQTKTLIADMLRYVAAANTAYGNTVASKVSTLLETAPVSELPELEAAVGDTEGLAAISEYIDKISVVYNTANGGVQFRFDKTQKALDVEAENTESDANLTVVALGLAGDNSITATDAAVGRWPQIQAGNEAYGNAFWYTHNMRVYDFDEVLTIEVRLDGVVVATAQYSVYDYLAAVKETATAEQWNLLLVTLAYSKTASAYTGY